MLTSNTLMLPPAQTITLLITISFAMIKSKRISIPRVTLAWKFQETEYWHWPRLVSSPHIGRYISHFQVKSPLFLRSDNSKFLGNFHVEVPFFTTFRPCPWFLDYLLECFLFLKRSIISKISRVSAILWAIFTRPGSLNISLIFISLHVMCCAIWYHLYYIKNVKNTHGGVLILVVKLQTSACNFTKINSPPWVFFTFFKLYRWYQIGQRTTILCLILAQKLPLYRNIVSKINGAKMQEFHSRLIGAPSGFSFQGADELWNSGEREETIFIPLYHFHIPTNSQAFS